MADTWTAEDILTGAYPVVDIPDKASVAMVNPKQVEMVVTGQNGYVVRMRINRPIGGSLELERNFDSADPEWFYGMMVAPRWRRHTWAVTIR